LERYSIHKLQFEPDSWLTAEKFEEALKKSGCLLRSDSEFINISFPSGCKVMLDAGARLLALINQLDSGYQYVSLDFSENDQAASYLNRIGFFELLSDSVVVKSSSANEPLFERYKGKNSSLVEFGSLDPNTINKDTVVNLTNSFVSLSNASYEAVAFTIFSEFIGNIYEHSQSTVFGFAALQEYKGYQHHIQVVVSDSGVGIAETLRSTLKEHHPGLYALYGEHTPQNNINLVLESVKNGKISRWGPGRGLGLFSTKSQAMKFKVIYTIRQEDFSLTLKMQDGHVTETKIDNNIHKIKGTHISFDFIIDRSD